MQRLSSGKRINAAKDDAAGVAIASRLTSHVRGLHQSIRNAMDAQALISTAEGGLQETEVLLQRIREFAVQASNDTNSDADRTNLNNEAQQLLAGIDAIASGTTWAGQNLLDGTYSNKSFQVGGGSMAVDQLSTSVAAATASALGVGTSTNTVETTTTETTTPTTTTVTTTNSTIVLNSSNYRNIFVRNFDSSNNSLIPETMVNASAASSNDNWTDNHGSSITHLSNGGYVVTWTDLSGRDGEYAGVYAQTYDSEGTKVGSEFQVNTTTSGYQWSMSVAGLNDGGFVISWQSPNSGGSRQINGQIYDSSGNKVGSELTFSNIGGNPSVSGFSNGGFVAVWDSGFANNGVAGTVFDSNYNSVANFTTSGAYPSMPRVTTLSNGNFFVVFVGTSGQINGQLFDPSANKLGAEVSISGDEYPHVTAIENGKFVVSFKEGNNVYKRQYDANGNAEENAVQLYSNSSNIQGKVRLSGLSDGDYVAVWDERNNSRSSLGIFGQRFNSDGSATGSVFKINSFDNAANAETWPSVTKLQNGGFAVTWRSLAVESTSTATTTTTTAYNTTSSTTTSTTSSTETIASIDLTSRSSLSRIDTALQTLNTQRASLGALSNRLDHVISNNTNASNNTQASLGRTQDADFAAETTKLAKSKILEQSSTAMLAQANASVYEVLTLIPNQPHHQPLYPVV